MGIRENVKVILSELPKDVILVAAIKQRTTQEVLEAIEAGIKVVGDNYVQEAHTKISNIKYQISKIELHFIGHLQTNKVKKAVKIFDMIETVDSFKIAEEIEKRCASLNKTMPVLIEVNSGREAQKAGVLQEDVEGIIKQIAKYPHIKLQGLMTMGPRFGDPEESKPYFVETRKIFEKIKSLDIPNVEMKYLSMGMSNSYKIAIEEGANVIRIGTLIFGERKD